MKRSTEAIVIFKLTNNETVFQKKSGKEFDSASEEWTQVIKFFKFGKDVSKVDGSNARARELKNLDYIFGPLRDKGFERTPEWTPEAWQPPKYQLCLKTSKMAEDFYNQGYNIHKVIFFSD